MFGHKKRMVIIEVVEAVSYTEWPDNAEYL